MSSFFYLLLNELRHYGCFIFQLFRRKKSLFGQAPRYFFEAVPGWFHVWCPFDVSFFHCCCCIPIFHRSWNPERKRFSIWRTKSRSSNGEVPARTLPKRKGSSVKIPNCLFQEASFDVLWNCFGYVEGKYSTGEESWKWVRWEVQLPTVWKEKTNDLLATWRTQKANWMLRAERWAPSVPKWKLKLRSSRWGDPVFLGTFSGSFGGWLAAKLLMSQKLCVIISSKSVIWYNNLRANCLYSCLFPSYSQSNLGAQAVLQAEAKHIDLQVPLMVGASKRETSRNIS